MNSVVSDPALIGIDWGTSSLRAFLISAGGDVLDQVSRPHGIMHVKDGDFEGSFRDLIGPLVLLSHTASCCANRVVSQPFLRWP